MAAKHPIVHIEISTKDREASGKFYEDVFGWEVKQLPEMNYATFDTGAAPGGGFNPATADYPAGTVLVYIDTDDIEATLGKVISAGGKVLLPKSEIPNMGWWAFFEDPSGNKLGLYTTLAAA